MEATHIEPDGTLYLSTLPVETAHCPLCNKDLPIKTDFGICRSRETGHNLYCKACIRAKVRESRAKLRDWRQNQKLRAQGKLPLIALVPADAFINGVLSGSNVRDSRHPHHERVFGAIHAGARTQAEIVKAIRPSHFRYRLQPTCDELDRVADSIAELLFSEPRRIQTEILEGQRVYTVRTPDRKPYADAPRSYSQLGGLMSPGPSVAVSGRRSSGWRAA